VFQRFQSFREFQLLIWSDDSLARRAREGKGEGNRWNTWKGWERLELLKRVRLRKS